MSKINKININESNHYLYKYCATQLFINVSLCNKSVFCYVLYLYFGFLNNLQFDYLIQDGCCILLLMFQCQLFYFVLCLYQ